MSDTAIKNRCTHATHAYGYNRTCDALWQAKLARTFGSNVSYQIEFAIYKQVLREDLAKW